MKDIIEKLISDNNNKCEYAGDKNPYIKYAQNIIENKHSNPKRLFPCEGIFQHLLALKKGIKFDTTYVDIEDIKTSEGLKILQEVIEKANKVCIVSAKVMQKIAEVNSMGGFFSLCELPNIKVEDLNLDNNSTIVVLDGVEIPGNIGTILRSADASGTRAVFICNKKARVTHPKVIRASLGSAFCVPIIEWATTKGCMDYLYKNKFKIYLADTRAKEQYYEPDYKGKVAFVMGSERYGITNDWYDNKHEEIAIPMNGMCDSLNVAVATTILLFESSIKQNKGVKRG